MYLSSSLICNKIFRQTHSIFLYFLKVTTLIASCHPKLRVTYELLIGLHIDKMLNNLSAFIASSR